MTDAPVVVYATTRQFESWKGVAVIADTLGSSGWALAGGQMVALRLLIADLQFPRVTIDADTIVACALALMRRVLRQLVLSVPVGWGAAPTTPCTVSPRRPASSSTSSGPMVFARGRSPSRRRPRCLIPVGRSFCDAPPESQSRLATASDRLPV